MNAAPSPPVDLDQLSRNTGTKDRDVLLSFVDLFLEEFPKLIAELEAAIAARDPMRTHTAAHTAKGAAANGAAPELRDVLSGLQLNAQHEDWAWMEDELQKVKTAHERIAAFRRDLKP